MLKYPIEEPELIIQEPDQEHFSLTQLNKLVSYKIDPPKDWLVKLRMSRYVGSFIFIVIIMMLLILWAWMVA